MYFDLFVPFTVAPAPLETGSKKGKKDKGKGKPPTTTTSIVDDPPTPKLDYWASITQTEKERATRTIGLAGHCESVPWNPLWYLIQEQP